MEAVETPIWEEPTRGDYPDPRLLALPGLEFMEAFHDGRILPPNIHHLVGLNFEEVGPGSARFTMPASPWLQAPQGLISGATLALLVDGPLGCAAQSLMPAATPYTTAELSLSYIRPVGVDSGLLTGIGACVHSGRTVSLTEVEVTDAGGNVVARSSSRLVRLPQLPLPEGILEDLRDNPPRPERREWDTPPPWQRPVRGHVYPQDYWNRVGGLEFLRGCIEGTMERPPISHLLGVQPEEVEEGASTWTMPASEWSSAPVPGRMYGGAIAYFAGNTIDGTIWTTVPAGDAFAPVDLKVYFLRPVTPDNRRLVARSRVLHRGRTIAIAGCEVSDADGKLAAVATGSALIQPGRSYRAASPAEAHTEGSAGD